MKKLFLLLCSMVALSSLEANQKTLAQKHIQEQMAKEQKFAQEQKFYQGEEYNLSEQKFDPKELDSIPSIEPENDFDMTDVYRDDI